MKDITVDELKVFVKTGRQITPEEYAAMTKLSNTVDSEYDADVIALAGDVVMSEQAMLRFLCLGKLIGRVTALVN